MKDVFLSAHGTFRTKYHIVWATKYRRRILNPDVGSFISKLLDDIVNTMPGCKIVERNILDDHIHLLAVIPPKYAVKDVVGRMKGESAAILKSCHPLSAKLSRGDHLWSRGYFVSTVGNSEKEIITYIRQQRETVRTEKESLTSNHEHKCEPMTDRAK